MKRLFDLLVAFIILILTVPVMVIIAILIRSQNGAPIFYISERMKTPDQPFNLIKLRTMSNAKGK